MRLERRSLPSRRVVIEKVAASVVLALPAAHLVYRTVRWRTSDVGYVCLELGIAALAAVIAVHVEDRYGRRRAVFIVVALAYLGARTFEGGFRHPGSLQSWSPYPVSVWVWPGLFSLLAIWLQVRLLRPLVPVLVRDAGRVRKLVSLILALVAFGGWDWLSGAIGSASAGLICALAMLLVVLLAADRAFMLFGIAACAGFLAVSALVQQPIPSGFQFGDNIAFRIAPPPGVSLNTSGLTLEASISVAPATLIGCPTQADVEFYLVEVDSKAQEQLMRSGFELLVDGSTRITDSRTDFTTNRRQVIDSLPTVDSPGETQFRRTGLETDGPNSHVDNIDTFDFRMPLQSWRSIGACYVKTPDFSTPSVVPATYPGVYSEVPGKVTVQMTPAAGMRVDLNDTSPAPVADSTDPGAYDWTCYVNSQANSAQDQCPAVAAVTANWAGSYSQLVMLLVGTLIAIAAARWFHRVQDGEDKEPPGEAKPAAAKAGAGPEEDVGN